VGYRWSSPRRLLCAKPIPAGFPVPGGAGGPSRDAASQDSGVDDLTQDGADSRFVSVVVGLFWGTLARYRDDRICVLL